MVNYNCTKIEYYYTLKDIFENTIKEAGDNLSFAVFNTADFYDFLSDYFFNASFRFTLDENETSYFQKLWELNYSRYLNNYCLITDYKINTFSYNKDIINFFIRYLNIWISTHDRYIKLIKLYEDSSNKLLDKIKTDSSFENRYNDTPQDYGDFSDDNHTTNITKGTNTSSTDGYTIMARINEIEKLYEDVLLNWSREFDKIFLEVIE